MERLIDARMERIITNMLDNEGKTHEGETNESTREMMQNNEHQGA